VPTHSTLSGYNNFVVAICFEILLIIAIFYNSSIIIAIYNSIAIIIFIVNMQYIACNNNGPTPG